MIVGAQKELTVGHDDKMTELPFFPLHVRTWQACAREILHSGDPRMHLINATRTPLVYPHVTDLQRPSIPVVCSHRRGF